ncbi:MAG: YbaN family protein [Planctomycetota bacterium]
MNPHDPTAKTGPTPKPLSRPLRWLLAGLAVLCFAVGWAGVAVPGLPTTVFWLLAVLLAGKSCPAVQRWVYRRGALGRTVEDIVVRRAMTRPAKAHALVGLWGMMSLSAATLWWLAGPPPVWLLATLAAVGIGVSSWITFRLNVLPPTARPASGV